MIKQLLLNYKGYHNHEFQFIDENGQKFNFKKSRRELINDFDLTGNTNVNKQFLVSYFVDETPNYDIYILTDMIPSHV